MNTALSDIEIGRTDSARKQLTQQLRKMIVSGSVNEGSKLPSNRELSKKWGVATTSVQAAMTVLVKEGLLHRAPKRGTFVAKRSRKLTRVGIYLSENIWRVPEAAFRRTLIAMLSDQLQARKLELDIWIDPRPQCDQGQPWDRLIQAVNERRIQAILLVHFTLPALTWLQRLQVPSVALTPARLPHCLFYEIGADERLAVEDLSRQGCRSAGLIAPLPENSPQLDVSSREYALSLEVFRQHAAALGLEVRNDWIQHSSSGRIAETDSEHFGYEAMKRLLALPDRPQGIYVTHDVVARGALTAVLESRVNVPEELKLVLHRNAEIGLLCPLQASFVDFGIADAAQAMIRLMDAQLDGEEDQREVIRPRIVPVAVPSAPEPGV